jgi:hypothetical protein
VVTTETFFFFFFFAPSIRLVVDAVWGRWGIGPDISYK